MIIKNRLEKRVCVDIEYLYVFLAKNDNGFQIFQVSNDKLNYTKNIAK